MSEIAKAYSRLNAFVQTVEGLTDVQVKERYVDEYHSIIDQVSTASSSGLAEFRIGENDVRQRVSTSNYVTGAKTYSADKYIDRALLLMKARGLLTYFTFTTAEPPREIGFRPPAGG